MNNKENFKENLKQVSLTLRQFRPTDKDEQIEVRSACTMINEMLAKLYPDDIDMANKVVMHLANGYIECLCLSGELELIDVGEEVK